MYPGKIVTSEVIAIATPITIDYVIPGTTQHLLNCWSSPLSHLFLGEQVGARLAADCAILRSAGHTLQVHGPVWLLFRQFKRYRSNVCC